MSNKRLFVFGVLMILAGIKSFGAQGKMDCKLSLSSSAVTMGENIEEKKSTFEFNAQKIQTQNGSYVATPSLIVTGEELSKIVVGDGPLAKFLKQSTLSLTGLFLSKNSAGVQLNNSSLRVLGAAVPFEVTSIGKNTDSSILHYSLESDDEWHNFSLECTSK